MTAEQRARILEAIERQREITATDKEAARKALMRSGLYRSDGTLKTRYGGKKLVAVG
ncbi:MAG: hypothetical protein ABI376_11070 [Caulobacteraceae bacterium]